MKQLIITKTEDEIAVMRVGGKILGNVLQVIAKMVTPGVRIKDLNDAAEGMIRKAGAMPAFLGYKGFPATLCVSLNDEVVHGSGMRERVLKGGDVAGLDLGLEFQGMIVDAARTVEVGSVSKDARRLVRVTKDALQRALEVVHDGVRVGDISFTVQSYVEQEGFGVVRDLVGHGVGRSLHEPPEVPNFGVRGTGPVLRSGVTIAIEPMVAQGGWQVKTLSDGWTVVTEDGSLSAHFEHTVLVTKKGCEILTKP